MLFQRELENRLIDLPLSVDAAAVAPVNLDEIQYESNTILYCLLDAMR